MLPKTLERKGRAVAPSPTLVRTFPLRRPYAQLSRRVDRTAL